MHQLRRLAATVAVAGAVVASAAVPANSARVVPPSPKAKAAASIAVQELGVPYQWNGVAPVTGFDSSGLVVWAFARAGVIGLPHYAGDLWTRGARVSRGQLQRGDLVFFNHASHVGIYIGHGKFVDAPHTGASVRIANLSNQPLYTGAVRIG